MTIDKHMIKIGAKYKLNGARWEKDYFEKPEFEYTIKAIEIISDKLFRGESGEVLEEGDKYYGEYYTEYFDLVEE